jgi:hypothetical protein
MILQKFLACRKLGETDKNSEFMDLSIGSIMEYFMTLD